MFIISPKTHQKNQTSS